MKLGKSKSIPRAAYSRLSRSRESVGEIVRDAISNYQTNGDTNQAAAIALYALLSIIPLFILTLLIVDNLFSADPEIRGKLIEGIREVIPSFSGELITQIGRRIEGKNNVLGWVGIVTLIWFSSTIFGAIETAMDFIMRVKTHRNYFASKLLALAMIPLGWAVGVVSVGITSVAAILARQPFLTENTPLFTQVFRGTFFPYLLPYLVTVLYFTVVYKVIPSGNVGLLSALIGSAVFSALMEIAKQFFAWYVANYAAYNVIFGSLEAVVILVIWVFYIALIFLFCAELISSYERRDMILIEKALLKPGKDRPAEERLLRKFGRTFGRGEYIFREGDTGRDIFYILKGRIRMEKGAGQLTKTLAEVGTGEYFGEMAALISAPRTASARCIEACDIAVIEGEMLHELLRANSEVALLMLKDFANRLRQTDAALEELALSWIKLLVTLYLLRSWPISEERNIIDDLARAAGREKGEIEETLAALERSGVLTRADGRVTGFNREEALRLPSRERAHGST